VALSPSLWWNEGALVKGAASRLDAWPRGRERTLYVATASDDDIGGAALALRDVLRARAPAGLRWQHEAWAELDHSNIYRRASPAVFRKVFANR
jgi:predicted alpha/beta superfamily hydrolase